MDAASPSSAVPSRDTMQGAVSMAASAAEDSAPPAAGGAGEATSSAGRHGETASGASSGSVKKRSDYLSWDSYFMGVAHLSAMRSKDPSTQVGCCIVDSEKRICAVGYNGFPSGISDDALPWARTAEDPLDTKYPYVVHAEANAILNRNAASLRGCTAYVALFPCNECCKLIIQSGIKEVVYVSDKYHDTTPMKASRRMLELAGVVYRQYLPPEGTITIDFSAAL